MTLVVGLLPVLLATVAIAVVAVVLFTLSDR